MAEDKATFGIDLEGNVADKADDDADALERLRSKIQGSEQSIREMSGSLRRLRGDTEEVKAAKEQLRAKIQAERDAISGATQELVKQGTSYDKLNGKVRDAARAREKMAKSLDGNGTAKAKADADGLSTAFQKLGGPAAGKASSGLDTLRKVAGQGSSGMQLTRVAAFGLALGLAALAAAAVAGVASIAKWAIGQASMLRTLNLTRQAALGNAKDAAALGTQVEALADKVSLGREQLNGMAVDLVKNKLGGQVLVDSFNAVGQAAAAMDDQIGAQIQGLITRGKNSKRFSLGRFELDGSGLDRDDVAGALAKNMKVGLGAARQALAQGRVKLADGAKALRDAVEAKFGEINISKLSDLGVLTTKLQEKLGKLTTGINLKPLAEGAKRLFALFDESSVTGAAMKELVTIVGSGLVSAFDTATKYAKPFLQGLIIGALQVTIGVLKLRKYLMASFGDSSIFKGFASGTRILSLGKTLIYGTVVALLALGAAIAVGLAPFVWAAVQVSDFVAAVQLAYTKLAGVKWGELGTALIDGFVKGITGGASKVWGAITGVGDNAKKALKAALGINSPSKVFAKFGAGTVEGYVQGVDREAPQAQRAVDDMAPMPFPRGGDGNTFRAPSSGSRPVKVDVTINAAGGDVTSDSFRAQLL